MNNKTKTILKSVVIILILLAIVFAIRVPAGDINGVPSDVKAEYVDSSGLPYFSEMDSYYNLRMTQDLIDHGYYGDTMVNNTQVDNHRYSPNGMNTTYTPGIGIVTSFMYNLANIFGHFDVKTVAFWTGAIISCLAIIPSYIIVRRVTNDYGAIAASLIITLSPNYFAHTFPGFFDTDMFVFVFPLFIVLFFIECIRSNNRIHKLIYAILAVLSIMAFAKCWDGYVFYLGMLAIFVVIYLIANLYFSLTDPENRASTGTKIKDFFHQKEVLSVIGLVVLLVIGLLIVDGSGVLGIVNNVLSGFALQASSTSTGFPNVMVSVAELQVPALSTGGVLGLFLASTGSVVSGVGGIICFIAALVVLYTYITRFAKLRRTSNKTTATGKLPKNLRQSASVRSEKIRFEFSLKEIGEFGSRDELIQSRKETLLYLTLFLVWAISACAAVTQGSRFITLLILPFGLLTGIFVGYAADYIKSKRIDDKKLAATIVIAILLASYPVIAQVDRTFGITLLIILLILTVILFDVKKPLVYKDIPYKKYLAIFCIFLAIVAPTVTCAYATSNSVVPGTNDEMWDSMNWIQQNEPNNTVIASWWDFGYLFEIAANRQTMFDGGMQGTDGRAYWMGEAMTTDNLELSAGIFRMLGTSGYEPVYNVLEKYTHSDNGTTVEIVNKILPQKKSDAKNTLTNQYHVSSSDADKVLSYTHPDNPRPVIFVASSDMLQKAGWWTYFGSWKFEGSETEQYQYYPAKNQTTILPGHSGKIDMLDENGINVSVVVNRGNQNNTTTAYVETRFANNNSVAEINGTDYNPLKASNILVVEDNYLVKNQTIGNASDGNYTLYLLGSNNTYMAVLMSNELVDSMFTRLYLLGSNGQDIFTQVHMANGVSLWRVNFNNTVAGGGSGSSSGNNTTG